MVLDIALHYILSLSVIALIVWGLRVRISRKAIIYPPGPKPLPIVGNVFNVPRKHLGREFRDMSDKYGDLVYLNVLGQPIVVLASHKLARELLDKRSANYSDRPVSAMAQLAGLHWVFVLMQYGQEWRRHRRAFHQCFNTEISPRYQPIQLDTTRQLLVRLLDSPKDLANQLKFSFATTVMRAVYGIDLLEHNDQYFQMVEEIADVAEDIAVPGRYAVESLPFLRYIPSWLPGAGFKRYALKAECDISHIIDKLYAAAKMAMETGNANESVVTHILGDLTSLDTAQAAGREEMCKSVTATTYVAAADTTNAAIRAFFLAMALYPEVQKKAQEHIDAVVGSNRLPEFCDREALPYINALIKELLRWHTVAPICVAHRTGSDDEYNGYHIPGGTIIIPNIWGMSHDAVTYPDPENLLPDRFLDDKGKVNFDVPDPSEFAFGFGRRLCPGRHFGEASLFILCTSVLYAFDIRPPEDEDGIPMKIEHEMTTTGMISHPKVYEYIIKPRSPQAERLVLEFGAAT